MVNPFVFSTIPKIIFGTGSVKKLQALIPGKSRSILLVTGKTFFYKNQSFSEVIENLKSPGRSLYHEIVTIEPTPERVDEIVQRYRDKGIDEVIGAGGGSVMDAAKAVSAMLPVQGSVKDYLEGFKETKSHPGLHVQLTAIPTTAGTGSEATKNAVLSNTGRGGFKRSLRHDNFIPSNALIDPELTLTCPINVTAASGLDAFTQLLESYVSTKSNPFTDSLALSGLKQVAASLEKVYHDGTDIMARTGMSYAALCSGITLANAGLGTVHGFASSIGGRFDIPHGVICGTLLAPVTEMTIKKLKSKDSDSEALKKYAATGLLFCKNENKSADYYLDFLIAELYRLTEQLHIPKLSDAGFDVKETEFIAGITSCKNNPVELTEEELTELLSGRI